MKKNLPSWIALLVVGAVGTGGVLGANSLTSGRIAQQQLDAANAAQAAVMEAADRFEPLELKESRYRVEEAFAAQSEAGETVGYVGRTTVTGYGGPVEVAVGLDMEGTITGVTVGGEAFAETPGLGALTREAAFTDQFIGKKPSIVLNEGGVDTVTGASTTSRAVVSGVNSIANYFYTEELGLAEVSEEAYMGQTWSSTKPGFGGDVTVTVGRSEDGAIEYMAVDTPNETDGLGKLASEKAFTDQFIGKTGPFTYGEDGIEAVTGATFTSTAVLEAINEIVAGGGAASDEPLTATAQGFAGPVTVTVRLNPDNTIAALSIDTPDETDGLGKLASESAFTDQFIGKAAPFAYGEDGIEAVTGATFTSTAVLEALNSIVPAGDKSASTAQTAQESEAEAQPATEAPEEPAAEPETEPAQTPAETSESADASRMMRARPALTETSETTDTAVGTDASRMMRPRPAATETSEMTDTAVGTNASRMMRARPALTETSETTDTAVGTDASRMMRARPATAEAAPAESAEAETAEESADASRMMRARPAMAEAAPAESAEAETAEETTGSVDASRMMRARPAAAADEPDDAPGMKRVCPATEETEEEAAEPTDVSRMMRARPAK